MATFISLAVLIVLVGGLAYLARRGRLSRERNENNVSKALRAASEENNLGRKYPARSMYCITCGSIATPRGMPGFELIFVLFVSIFTLFIPLMIYLFVRSGKRCRRCGKKTLVPLDSPVAVSALRSTLR
jgi:hypothetical protein